MHIPSFMVGTAVSGTGFLMIHKELSHRERLSKKWRFREVVEENFYTVVEVARKQVEHNRRKGGGTDSTPTSNAFSSQSSVSGNSLAKAWNSAVLTVQGNIKDGFRLLSDFNDSNTKK